MSAELERHDAPHSPHAQIFLVLTDVNVNLDSLVMVITVSMSTNVLTIHAERMHHAQTLLVHIDAHVTEATKVTNCYNSIKVGRERTGRSRNGQEKSGFRYECWGMLLGQLVSE